MSSQNNSLIRPVLTLVGNSRGETALAGLRDGLASSRRLLRLAGTLAGTKTPASAADIVLYRDFEMELMSRNHLNLVCAWPGIIERYVSFDAAQAGGTGTPATVGAPTGEPAHYPARLVAGAGPLTNGENIFLFMPYAVGVVSTNPADHFSMELIDVGGAIMSQIVWPGVAHLFEPGSQLEIIGDTPPGLPVERAIYAQSLLHEAGHRFGPWRVIPAQAPGMALGPHFGSFEFDTLGEISTDAMAAALVPERPDLMRVTALQRIFAFARRGFSANPTAARINEDNDSWMGACLWKRFRSAGAIRLTPFGWEWNDAAALAVYTALLNEVDAIGRRILGRTPDEQLAQVREWMNAQLPRDANGRFVLPQCLREAYYAMRHLPEQPSIRPPVALPITTRNVEFRINGNA